MPRGMQKNKNFLTFKCIQSSDGDAQTFNNCKHITCVYSY